MDYTDKAESKRQAKDALSALREAERFLEEITKFGAEIQITRTEFDALVAETRAIAKASLGWQALALALIADEPVPMMALKPWSSSAMIYRWRKLPADQHPLPVEILNEKICVRPSDFFQALKTHGRTKTKS